MERLRDQVGLEPPPTSAAAHAKLDQLEERLTTIQDKAGRGGDVGGLLGPLEADAASFERDLIVGGVLRRQQAAGQPPADAQVPAGSDQAAQAERLEVAGRLRADLIARGQQLDELVDRAATEVPNPPKYAVPDVTSLGPVPQTPAELERYLASRPSGDEDKPGRG